MTLDMTDLWTVSSEPLMRSAELLQVNFEEDNSKWIGIQLE